MSFPETGSTLPLSTRKDKPHRLMTVLVVQALATATTSVATPSLTGLPMFLRDPSATNVPVGALKSATTASEMLDEIKNDTGLTWEQIARLMGVSRRSIHLWLQGKAVSAPKEERLHSVLYIVRLLTGRSQLDARSKILDKSGGASVAELLGAGRDDEAEMLARERAAGNVAPTFFDTASDKSREILDARRSPVTALDLLETGSGPVKATGGKAKRARAMKRGTADAE